MTTKTSNIADLETKNHKDNLRTILHVIYGSYILSIFLGIIPLIFGVIFAYYKRKDSLGTIYKSHFYHLTKTFWIYLLICLPIIFFVLIFFLAGFLFNVAINVAWIISIGLITFILITIWFLYRVIRGWIFLFDEKEIL